MATRRTVWLLSAASWLCLAGAGCRGVDTRVVTPNPLLSPTADYDATWNATVRVVDEYFDIETENRLAGKIVTKPKIGATLAEPWYGDSVGAKERLESTLQTIRRFAVVQVSPAPTGGYAVKVEVYKELEDMPRPERQTGGMNPFVQDFPVNRTREVVGPAPSSAGWIPRGRDPKLEQAILDRVRDALFL